MVRTGRALKMVFSLLPNAAAISREHAASLHSILALSMLMTESANEEQILHFATTSLPSLAPSCELAGVYCSETSAWKLGSRRLEQDRALRAALERQVATLGQAGGTLTAPGTGWAFGFALRSIHECVGFIVVVAETDPTPEEQFLLRVLAQQTGVALTNARMVKRSRDTAAELASINDALGQSLADLHRTMDIHARLDEVASSGRGRQALAQVLHELTGFSVAIEDRYGNLRAWAPGKAPDPYPKAEPPAREQLLRELSAGGRSQRHGDRLIALASPRADVVGILALLDPDSKAGKFELVALEHAATVLAMELARLASSAEAELRVRRDLVEELLAGADNDESVVQRAQALGLDLERPHRVVIIHGQGRSQGDDHLLHVVKLVARDIGAGSLLVGRGKSVILLTGAELDWQAFRESLVAELGGGRCRVAVGSPCQRPSEFPRSHREAQLAATLQNNGAAPEVLTWESLGIYGILSNIEDLTGVERFVQSQLGPLLEYDAQKNSNLVETLFHYLESGGNYAGASEALIVHRSTLKYRLQRIREIGRCDLSDPGTRFNLQLATRAWQILKCLGRLA